MKDYILMYYNTKDVTYDEARKLHKTLCEIISDKEILAIPDWVSLKMYDAEELKEVLEKYIKILEEEIENEQ